MNAVVFADTGAVAVEHVPDAVLVTHHGGLDDAPRCYQAFDQHADGVIKAVLRR
jgi:threonine dehydrogenase-like Zn-dependent dehydrogenase